MKIKTCFEILSIPEDASLDEAKQAYKHLVKRWHPDQYGNDPEKQQIAQEKLKEINVAYREVVAILKNTGGSPDKVSKAKTENRQSPPEVLKKKRKKILFEKVASFFRSQFDTKNKTDDPKNQRESKISQEAHERMHDPFMGDRPVPEFSQVLKRAIRNHPRGAARQKLEIRAGRTAGKRRTNRPLGNSAISQPFPASRRHRGDRIEKIKPIRPVGKI